MKIVIVGGWKKAEFLIQSLLSKRHKLIVIHDNLDFCKTLSRTYDINVVCGNGSQPYVLDESRINDYDLLIAMTPKDSDNLVICQLAKKNYGVKKTFATVSNPKNVDVFKKLGIDAVISATYIVSGIIEQMAIIENMTNFIPLGEGQIGIMEIAICKKHKICNQQLSKIDFPENAIIACILRGPTSIIPKGKTQIQEKDKLLILSPPNLQNKVIHSIIGEEI